MQELDSGRFSLKGFRADEAEGFGESQPTSYVVDFLSSSEGLSLNKAFVRIEDPKVRRRIVDLVRSLAGDD